MIEAERVLYYFEHVALLLDESRNMQDSSIPDDQKEWHGEQIKKFLGQFYQFCHVGTGAMHHCQHPDWEAEFIQAEREMIESRHMTPYEEEKKRGPAKHAAMYPFKPTAPGR